MSLPPMPNMTVGDLRRLLRDLADDTEIDVFNSSYEWYGVEDMDARAWKVVGGRLVYLVGNCEFNADEVKDYLRDNAKRAKDTYR